MHLTQRCFQFDEADEIRDEWVEKYFIFSALAGTPIQMKVVNGDRTVFELEQVARLRPEAP